MATPKAKQKPTNAIPLTINGKSYTVDLDELELWELELLEDEFDCAFDQVDFNRVKAIRILAFIAMRRTNAKLTMGDVATLKISAFEDADDDVVPTKPAKRAG